MRLRTRLIALFTGGAFVLSAALALTTYQLTRHNLLQERERTAVRAAYFDAAVVRPAVVAGDADVVAALRALDTGHVRQPLVRRGSTWYARNADDGLTRAVPASMLRQVESGKPSVQLVRISGQAAIVVGVPFLGDDSAYYEVQSLQEAEVTLRSLAGILTAVALAATAAAAALSLWVSRRALSPLRAVTATAHQVSSGDLSARMRPSPDPDLDVLSRSFNAMVTEVAQRVERERRFAADVSHELRSPLQTLASASQVLLNRQAELGPRAAEAARLMGKEVERFTQLVQSLLDLARADRPLQLEETDVVALVESALHRHGLSAGILSSPERPLCWRVDPPRLSQALDNLLSNADKHGGGAVAVNLCRSEPGLRLEVDDTGPGIPPEEREVVFHRFGRGRASHARHQDDGVGLGLSLVAEHVRAHRGEVEVQDRPGGGCRVVMSLPESAS